MTLRGQPGDWIQRAVSGGPWGKDRQQAEPVGNLGTLGTQRKELYWDQLETDGPGKQENRNEGPILLGRRTSQILNHAFTDRNCMAEGDLS